MIILREVFSSTPSKTYDAVLDVVLRKNGPIANRIFCIICGTSYSFVCDEDSAVKEVNEDRSETAANLKSLSAKSNPRHDGLLKIIELFVAELEEKDVVFL